MGLGKQPGSRGIVLLEIAEYPQSRVIASKLRADVAFAEWGKTTKARAECLLKSGAVIENGQVFAELSCPGKPL